MVSLVGVAEAHERSSRVSPAKANALAKGKVRSLGVRRFSGSEHPIFVARVAGRFRQALARPDGTTYGDAFAKIEGIKGTQLLRGETTGNRFFKKRWAIINPVSGRNANVNVEFRSIEVDRVGNIIGTFSGGGRDGGKGLISGATGRVVTDHVYSRIFLSRGNTLIAGNEDGWFKLDPKTGAAEPLQIP